MSIFPDILLEQPKVKPDDPRVIPPDHLDTAIIPWSTEDWTPNKQNLPLTTSRHPSHLSFLHRLQAVKMVQQAAVLGLHNRSAMHYTQGVSRWSGIQHGKRAWRGEFPYQSDCSAFATWCLWCALSHFHEPDIVNRQHWRAGYTGTLEACGIRVNRPSPADLVFYPDHVAVYTGGGLVVSHGSEGGPYLLPYAYRHVKQIRRYI